jgi:hypothetical protein
MKSTAKIKEELENTISRIDILEKEMQEKGISYEDSRNHFKFQPDGSPYSIGITYSEYLGNLVQKKSVLEFVLS